MELFWNQYVCGDVEEKVNGKAKREQGLGNRDRSSAGIRIRSEFSREGQKQKFSSLSILELFILIFFFHGGIRVRGILKEKNRN